MAYSFAKKFNKTSFDIDTTGFEYIKLADIFNGKNGGGDVVHNINGIFIHKSRLGDSPVVIDTDNKLLVNFPSHTTDVCREILSDDDAIQAIKEGKVGYVIYDYDSHGKKCYGIKFVDK